MPFLVFLDLFDCHLFCISCMQFCACERQRRDRRETERKNENNVNLKTKVRGGGMENFLYGTTSLSFDMKYRGYLIYLK